MRPEIGTDAGGVEVAGPQPAGPVDFGVLPGQVFAGEPSIGHGVALVYRRADRRHRRRLQVVLAIGAVAAALVAALGLALATAVVPDSARRVTAGLPVPAPGVDPALTILRTAAGQDLRVQPREPSRGEGWRQYAVLTRATGKSRGLIEVSVYTAPDGICFPVLADPKACARPARAGADVEYVRYGSARDVDWQVYQAMARRLSDGRVLTVLATGERGTGDAVAGRPPLTPLQTVTLASNPALFSAFGPGETCDGPEPACPLLIAPVPARAAD